MLTLTSLAGMAIAGAGAGVNELTALAATSEMAPTRKRGIYVSALIFTIVPFCPSVLWAQLIAYYSHWRYVGAFCGAWSAFGLLVTIFFYFPPPRVNSQGLSKKEIIGRIDFVGGFLSITGLIVFLAGLQWGGYMVRLTGDPPSKLALLANFMFSTPGARPMFWRLLSLDSSFSLPLDFGKSTGRNIRSSRPA